jgi:hypothetical protein
VRTMNTWWDGFRIDEMRTFEFHFKGGTLPIELYSLNASVIDNSVKLNWVTLSETNNDFFTIERSQDGSKFETVGIITGAGNSNNLNDYEFLDLNPFDINYYRLKQTDFDGNFSYSKIIVVRINSGNQTNIQIAGSGDNLFVNSNIRESGQMHINIYDLNGKLVYGKSVEINEGSNYNVIKPKIRTGSLYLVTAGFENETPFINKVHLN